LGIVGPDVPGNYHMGPLPRCLAGYRCVGQTPCSREHYLVYVSILVFCQVILNKYDDDDELGDLVAKPKKKHQQ